MHGRTIDEGYSRCYPISNVPGFKPPADQDHFSGSRGYNDQKVSEVATKAIFWWSCDQVEQGFEDTLVPFRSSGRAPRDSPERQVDNEAIDRWREGVLGEAGTSRVVGKGSETVDPVDAHTRKKEEQGRIPD